MLNLDFSISESSSREQRMFSLRECYVFTFRVRNEVKIRDLDSSLCIELISLLSQTQDDNLISFFFSLEFHICRVSQNNKQQ